VSIDGENDMKLLEIANSYKIMNLIEPSAGDVAAVHEDVGLTKQWLIKNVRPGNGLYDYQCKRYLMVADLMSDQIVWRDSVRE
jgi:hypothetical protein